jgi:peptidoglycan/LPS O-acetylase OafA/YrhL
VWTDAIANPASASVYQSPAVSVAVVGIGMLFILFAAFGLRDVKWRGTAMVLGGLTYPLYLMHNRVGESVMGLANKALHAPRPIQAFAFCLVVALAFVVAQVLEPPFRRSIRKLWSPAPRAAMQS